MNPNHRCHRSCSVTDWMPISSGRISGRPSTHEIIHDALSLGVLRRLAGGQLRRVHHSTQWELRVASRWIQQWGTGQYRWCGELMSSRTHGTMLDDGRSHHPATVVAVLVATLEPWLGVVPLEVRQLLGVDCTATFPACSNKRRHQITFLRAAAITVWSPNEYCSYIYYHRYWFAAI